jgi:hypothetical protein
LQIAHHVRRGELTGIDTGSGTPHPQSLKMCAYWRRLPVDMPLSKVSSISA